MPALLFVAAAADGQAQTAPGGGDVAESRFRLIRSTSGSKGTLQGGRYVVEDPRNVFYLAEDRNVVVFFEWQGPAGTHHCEGVWKDPSGKAALTSASDYRATGARFGVYWTLALPDSVPTGRWTLETRVDSEPAGIHAFEILAGHNSAAAAATKRPLLPGELYKRGLELTLTVEALDAAGKRMASGSGFFVDEGLLLTAFDTVNAARALRVTGSDGRRLESNELAAWNRREGWAVVKLPVHGQQRQPVPSLAVGDRCYFLDPQQDGSRVIVEADVVGEAKSGKLTLTNPGGEEAAGAPVFNDYAEIAAMIGAPGLLGATPLDFAALGRGGLPGRGAIPLSLVRIPPPDTKGTALVELEQRGEFVRPLLRTPHGIDGVFGTRVDTHGPVPVAVDQRFQFSRDDGEGVVFVTWSPAQKQDALVKFQLFDEDNKKLGESEPTKARLRRGSPFVQFWKLLVRNMRPGIYRVDVLLDADPVMRLFFRVVD